MDINLLKPEEKYIHRDLSWLSFNERVLEEAEDLFNPLLERLNFMAIFVNNLDEFFMVRLAGLKRLLDSEYIRQDRFGYVNQDLYNEIKIRIASLNKRLYSIYINKIEKELADNKIFIKKFEELNNEQKRYVKRYFDTTIYPIATPMAVDQGRPLPLLPSKTIAFAVSLIRYTTENLAILPIPKSIPRLLQLPSPESEFSFILIDELIKQNLDSFFKGYKLTGSSIFRVMRDSELLVDEEYAPDILRAIETELKKRPRAKVVHLEVEKSYTPEILNMLCQQINFPQEEVTVVDGPLALSYLFELIPKVTIQQLRYPAFLPAKLEYENIFNRIRERDFLLHLPYQSFHPTVDFISCASEDRDVLAIKMTLYRTNEDSSIIKALKTAARNKKQVTILVEIKARFDEEKNISWVRELEDAGCHVMYGIAGMKIHSKITMIIRKEEDGVHRYVHLSTGNYNEKTALIYSDMGYFTDNDDIAGDISDVFNVITGYSLPSRWKRVVSSPKDMREYFFELINKEINYQQTNNNGLIFAKMNSLEDIKIIDKLYEASCAGVKVKLLVRGICCLIPGVPGMSENIEVKSIVGRFLEHTRLFIFNNNSNYRVFLSSADWMRRNFDNRIELLFEIYREELKEHLKFVIETYWNDDFKSRLLTPERVYKKDRKGETGFNSQDYFIRYYAGSEK